MKKYGRYIIALIIALVIGLSGRYLVNKTTLFVDLDTEVPEHFLPISDYVLVDSHTKEPVQKIKCLKYEYEDDSYDYGYGLETTKGINCNSTFEEFVEAYGEYVATYISCDKANSDDYNDDINLYNITINTFYNEYILTDKCNLDDYNIYINFSCYTKLNKVYYTQRDKDNAEYNNNVFWSINVNEFNLIFDYECKNYDHNNYGKGIFDYISSSKWD